MKINILYKLKSIKYRLGRDADDVIAELMDLKAKGIKVVSLDIPYMNN